MHKHSPARGAKDLVRICYALDHSTADLNTAQGTSEPYSQVINLAIRHPYHTAGEDAVLRRSFCSCFQGCKRLFTTFRIIVQQKNPRSSCMLESDVVSFRKANVGI